MVKNLERRFFITSALSTLGLLMFQFAKETHFTTICVIQLKNKIGQLDLGIGTAASLSHLINIEFDSGWQSSYVLTKNQYVSRGLILSQKRDYCVVKNEIVFTTKWISKSAFESFYLAVDKRHLQKKLITSDFKAEKFHILG